MTEIATIANTVRTVTVKFCHPSKASPYAAYAATAKEYSYLWNGMYPKPGTIVVVPVRGSEYPHVATVECDHGTGGFVSPKSTSWIITDVKTEEHERRIAESRKREELLVAMENRLSASSKFSKFEAAAAIDPEMARLLAEFKKINI